MITKLAVSFALLTFLFVGCDKKESSPKESQTQKSTKNISEEKNSSKTKTANVLHMIGSDGNKYDLIADYQGIKFKGYEGKIIILDFFATWCPPCRAEIPHLVDLQKKYKDKIQIFSVLMEENKDNLELDDFIKEFKINYPVLNSKENFFLSQALGGIRSLPTIVIYDKNGAYLTHYLGAAPQEMLESAIEKALKK